MSVKSRLLAILKVKLLQLPLILFSILFGLSILFLEYTRAAITYESNILTNTIEAFPPSEFEDMENLQPLKDHVFHTEAGDQSISWMLLMAAVTIQEGPEASNELVRKAINRLQGWDLALFIRSIKLRMPDTDRTQENERLQEMIEKTEPLLDFTPDEVAAIRSCESLLNSHYTNDADYLRKLLSAFNTLSSYSSSKFWQPPCSLSGKIAI